MSESERRLAALEAEAHELYFVRRDGMAALVRWRLCLALGPPSIEAQLALAHCEIEAGLAPDLPPVGVRDPAARSTGRLPEYAALILSCAWTHYDAGDARRAAQLARLVAAVDPHFRSVYEQQILAPAAGPAGGLPAPSAAPLPVETMAQPVDDAAARALLARHGRGVLLFMLQNRTMKERELEYSHCRQLRATLEALGIPVTIVEAYRLDYEGHLRLHERLRAAIAASRPSVILCADVVVSGATSYQPLQDGIFGVLEEARRTFGCKLVFTFTDTWYEGMPALLEALAGLPDLIHVASPGVLRRIAPAVAARTFCYPNPFEDLRRPDAPADQPARAGFVGSIGWANLSRLVWCAEIGRAGLPVDVHLTTPDTFRPPEAYAELMARYPIALNFAARINGDRISTGRSIEAPFYGSLLLEEAGEETAAFLRPYEHYVPFAGLAELSDRLDLLLRDAALRRRIAAAGTAWARRHFGALPFWSRLFHHLFEVEAPPAPAPSQHFRAVTLRFPHSAQTYLELARPLAGALPRR